MNNELAAHIFLKPLSIYDALTIEHILFDEHVTLQQHEKSRTNKFVILFWKSKKAAIIGRNQNPWKECNCAFLHAHDIPLARRDSGGGAVFHDEGNLNISVFSPVTQKGENRIHKNLELLVTALKTSHNIRAEISTHNDIFINNKKITGSAMRVIKTSLLHHFTLLLNADISLLHKALHPIDFFEIETKSVNSRPHPIANIHCATNLIIDAYIYLFEKSLSTKATIKTYKGTPKGFFAKESATLTHKRISSNAWIFNRTPAFHLHIPLRNIVHTAVFSEGVLRELKYNFQSICPYTYIDMSSPSLERTMENTQENTLLQHIAKILYQCYYCAQHTE